VFQPSTYLTNRRRKRPAALLVSAVLAVGAATAAVSTASAGSADDRGTSITITLPQEPESWNYWEVGANALRVPTFYNVQETLLENLPDGTIIPMLAEAYEVSEDGLTVTFHIREAKFHDGTDLDAADVVYSLNKNAESPLSKLSAVYTNVASVEATDDRTVVVTLTNPSASFIQEMGMSAGYIVPEGAHENYDLDTEMIGTGPYVFGEYRPDTSLTMTRFDDYWGELPYFENIDWRFVDDETAALNGLEAGEFDAVAAIVGEGVDRVPGFEENPDFQVVQVSDEVSYMFLNVNKPEFQDDRVRQAIAHAIDRQPYIDAALAGYGVPTCLMAVPHSVPYNSDYCPYPYDPERSMALLEEAGMSDLTIDFPFVTVAYHPTVMEIMVAQLDAVGINVETRGEDLTTWLDRTWTQGNYEISQITDSAPITQYGCEGGREPLGKSSQLCIPEFEDQLVSSDQVLDFDDHVAAMAEMTNTFSDLAWVIPMFAPNTPELARADLVGIQPTRINNSFDIRHLAWAD
jgi:peptide/nickel transport system substrate-binding protein